MASIAASTAASSFSRANLVQRGHVRVVPSTSLTLGVPADISRRGKVQCSVEEKAADSSNGLSMGASLVAAACAAAACAAAACAATASSPALALVDERMSTEGTGLSLGISNNLLGWILLGVFGVIWALYFLYTSTLEEDDDSGLSL